jgi:hypothetical protein
VDGTPNEAQCIDKVVDAVMSYKGHSEQILFTMTQLGKQSMILGFTWLKKHNPKINFHTQTVKMSKCLLQCCVGCQMEQRDEQKAKKEDDQWINTCQTSPLLAFVEDMDDEDDEFKLEPESPPEKQLEEGNWIWATGLLPEPEHIWASSIISQWLAKAFK